MSTLSLILLKSIALVWLAQWLWVCILSKSAASEWLALWLICCVVCGAAPWLTDAADFFYNNHWQGDCYHLSSMDVQKSWITCTSVWNCIQDQGHMLAEPWLCKHHLNCFVAKAKNNVTVPFLFCRKHTIQRMSRIWHLPSRVGNAYDCPYSGTTGVLKNCVFHPDVSQVSTYPFM